MLMKMLIKTARDFPTEDDREIVRRATIRMIRYLNRPIDWQTRGNSYQKRLSHFDKGDIPVFKWENFGGIS